MTKPTNPTIPLPLFENFTKAWQSVWHEVSVKSHAKDTLLSQHGEEASTVWMVISGWVTLKRITPDGKEVIVGLCSNGDLFGEAGFYAHAHYPYTAQIIHEGTELVAIPARVLRGLTHNHPDLSAYIMQLLGDRIANAQLKIEQMTTLTAPQRLGCFLLHLCQNKTEGAHSIDIPIEKHVIASYLGMKPETLSRSFQQLIATGVTVSHSHVKIEDVCVLRDFVCTSCGEMGMCATEEEEPRPITLSAHG